MDAVRGEKIAKYAFASTRHPHHQSEDAWEWEHTYEVGSGDQGEVPSVQFLEGQLLTTWKANTERVELPPDAYTNETIAKFNASTGKLRVHIMKKDPNSPAMLEKKALDPDGPHPKPVEVRVTGRPIHRPPDVMGHGKPSPAQAALHGQSTSPAIVGSARPAQMPEAGLAGTVASDMPTIVHQGGVLEAPSAGETIVRDYDAADTHVEVKGEASSDVDKAARGVGVMGLGATGQGTKPLEQAGRVLAAPGTTIVQGARERRLEAEFGQADGTYVQAARQAMHLPADQKPEGGTPTLPPAATGQAGSHVAGAEAAPERDNVNFDVMKEGGAWPTLEEGATQVTDTAAGAHVRAAAEDAPEPPVKVPGDAPNRIAEGLEAPAGASMGTLNLGHAVDAGGATIMQTSAEMPHAAAPAGPGEQAEEEEDEYEDEYEEAEEYYEEGEEGYQAEEFVDAHGVVHVRTDPTKEKVGLATHPLTAAELYPRADDGSYEPVSSAKHQVEEGGHGCDICCCNPCQCDKLTQGQYKASTEMSAPETKRMGKPAMHKVKKPDTGVKPRKHTARDSRMHAKTANAAQPHMSMAARTTAWTGNVPQDPAPGIHISASEVEQKVLHRGSSLRRPEKAHEAEMAAIGIETVEDQGHHGAKDHQSTYTGGRLIAPTATGIHLSSGRHEKPHALG